MKLYTEHVLTIDIEEKAINWILHLKLDIPAQFNELHFKFEFFGM